MESTRAERKLKRKEARRRKKGVLDNQHPFEEDPGTDGPPVQGRSSLDRKLKTVSLSWGSIDHHMTPILSSIEEYKNGLMENLEPFSAELKPGEHQLRVSEYLAL